MSVKRRKKPIKVCFVLFGAYPLFNRTRNLSFGGAEVQLYQLACELAKQDRFSVSFIVGDYGQRQTEYHDAVRVEKACANNIPKLWIFTGVVRNLFFFYLLVKMRSDVYVQRCAGIETAIVSFFCKLFRKKFIYTTAHITDIDGRYSLQNPLPGFFYEIGLRNASKILVQNEEDKRILLDKFHLNSELLKNSFPIDSDTLVHSERGYVLWVGRCVDWKRPEVFLRLATKFPDQQFLMILPKQDETLWNAVGNQALKVSNARIIEKVPFSQINGYFRKAKVFVNTSDYEGFPNTFVQAAMYGVPILSLNVNPDHFLDEYDCGARAGGSEDRLASDLEEMLGDEVLWKRQSENARRYAVENHDIKKNIDKLEEIIERIVGKK